ncbi:MAG: RsmB/NOP family class I SAM-dependent RNA methyltransferase [Rhizobiaceae bacterium]
MNRPPAKTRYQPDTRQRVGLAARKKAAAILERVVDRHQMLEAALDEKSGHGGFQSLIAKDRALVRAIVVTALRHRGRLDFILLSALDRKPPQKARHLLHTLHIAAAQILYMDVPDSAAVNLAVTALREDRRSARFASMANAVLRRISREKEEMLEKADAWQLAFPKWLGASIRRDFGQEKAAAIAGMISKEPLLDLTIKPGLTEEKRDQLISDLEGHLLETGSVRLGTRISVEKLAGYEDGHWWVQDAASALPAKMLGLVTGLQIADLCAAPGGKTAQLASGGAKVTSVDISGKRLARLCQNLERLKLTAEIVEADILDWSPGRRFDAVLLDAPCSSTGTIRRHPDVMWVKTEEDIASLVELQRKLIARSVELLKPGGTLIYANCSLLKQEGEDIVAELINTHSDLELIPVKPGEFAGLDRFINRQGILRTLPSDTPISEQSEQKMPAGSGGMDGFFAARFRKIQD